ncbi:hypothetical protein V6N13_106243 [Hibiscus sabdariffa]|uniref:Uncharacterized protein n=1 Tax=Hibiscus sabdariffa TaxID=183260 RepID=A0ABR2F027_9ROSI
MGVVEDSLPASQRASHVATREPECQGNGACSPLNNNDVDDLGYLGQTKGTSRDVAGVDISAEGEVSLRSADNNDSSVVVDMTPTDLQPNLSSPTESAEPNLSVIAWPAEDNEPPRASSHSHSVSISVDQELQLVEESGDQIGCEEQSNVQGVQGSIVEAMQQPEWHAAVMEE